MAETLVTAAALRLQALALPVGDVDPVEKLYRWGLQMKPASDDPVDGRIPLGWGNEDRVVLLDADRVDAPRETVTLRRPALPLEDLVEWLGDRSLDPVAATVAPEDESAATEAWPDARVTPATDETAFNRTVVTLAGPAEPRIELHVPLPKETLAPRNRMGPFSWRSADWSGLEIPGLLGVTTAAPDPDAMRAFLTHLGVTAMEADGDGPLSIGDHQWILERREPAGIYAFAIVVRAGRIMDLKRTLEHLGIEHRHAKNRLVARDPAGRAVLVHGVRGG